MNTPLVLLAIPFLCAGISGCIGTERNQTNTLRLTVETYGTLPDGNEVSLFTLQNKHGMIARITDYGALLVSLEVPDQEGHLADVTHGYDSLEGWLTNDSYFGATVGRFGNRIAHGRFTLDGEDYSLSTNNDPGGVPCALHGGIKGFDKVRWSAEPFKKSNSSGVTLTYVSPDGEEGYPGTLTAVITYTLNDDNELIWEARATVADKATPVNLVHHTYWNLSNDRDSSINDHLLTLRAKSFLPTNEGLIPTGEIAPVAGTPLDFTKSTIIGERVETDDRNLRFAGGYDHCWVLDPLPDGAKIQSAAVLHDPKTGRTLEVLTDQPGIQFYGGNFLSGETKGKGGHRYPRRSACCLETQRFPDSPNQEQFPTSILRPGETYSHTMVHKFSW